jgi:capsule polysaccharide export protein KpsE/RkpR
MEKLNIYFPVIFVFLTVFILVYMRYIASNEYVEHFCKAVEVGGA